MIRRFTRSAAEERKREPAAAPGVQTRPTALRMLRLLRPETGLLTVILALGSIGVGFAVTVPQLLGDITDKIFAGAAGAATSGAQSPQQALAMLRAKGDGSIAGMLSAVGFVPGKGIDFASLGMLLGLVLAMYVLAAVFAVLQGRLVAKVTQRLIHRLRAEAEAKFAHLPMAYVEGLRRGELLSRVTNDIDNLAMSLQLTMNQIITSVLTVIGVLAMMLWLSVWLALIAVVSVPVSAYVGKLVSRRTKPQFAAQWKVVGELTSHTEEMYSAHVLVKAYGRREQSAQTFRELNARAYTASSEAEFASGLVQPVMAFLGNLNYIAVAVVGGVLVASGSIPLGAVQAFLQYSRQFSQPLSQAASLANRVQSGIASARRVFELLDAPELESDPAQPELPGTIRGRIAFESVCFRYDPDKPVLDDLSFTAEPGETIAMVGPTGAGKTTVAALLLRFFEPHSGRITIDGVDVASMTRDDVRSLIGVVFQDTWLFGASVAENIAYGRPDATREQIEAAARAAYAHRFIDSLPDGYDTNVGDQGADLSAGEKQLITIARAFLADPPILILDEATSSVDSRTESLVQQAMASLRKGRTALVIAHRLATIRDADTIIVVESGRLTEQGSHQELLQSGGGYSRLYAAQFAAAVAAD